MSVKRPGSELTSDKSEKRAASEETLINFVDHIDSFENLKSTKMEDKIEDKIGTCLKKSSLEKSIVQCCESFSSNLFSPLLLRSEI